MLTKIRLKAAWLAVPVYLLLAQPTVRLILIGAVLALLGALIRAWAAGAIHKNQVLTTHGPYAFTRNPLYLGTFLIGLGFVVASGRLSFLLVFLLFFGLIYVRAMGSEESRLERTFGDDFRRYAAAVPRFFPRLARWSDVMGETSPAGRATATAAGAASPAAPAAGEASRAFRFERYVANGEYQTILGLGAMFLLLAVKLVV
ncbi:MAG: methyltransferase family protein [Longimicrobiales bacterium]